MASVNASRPSSVGLAASVLDGYFQMPWLLCQPLQAHRCLSPQAPRGLYLREVTIPRSEYDDPAQDQDRQSQTNILGTSSH